MRGKVYKGSETPYKIDTLLTSIHNYTTIGKYIIHGYSGKPSPIDNLKTYYGNTIINRLTNINKIRR